MGYFSQYGIDDEDDKRKKSSKKSTKSVRLSKEQLIYEIKRLDSNQDLEELKISTPEKLQEKLNLLSKRSYLKQYGKNTRRNLYGFKEDKQEETNGFGL